MNQDKVAGRWACIKGGVMEAIGRTTHNARMEQAGRRRKLQGELRISRGIFHDELDRLGLAPVPLHAASRRAAGHR